ncbi:hypothetical protein F511_17892 [Dorcoceras hygrometricum]|uniref:Uncharacterized protein n=1 Tax=Dorcoceras hygrometricum TaxID=472368 RepID=A0A2Z7AM89_9LAMI|nr:hypothetical protein F511_17892 [Dorcoceras hygrometricum]
MVKRLATSPHDPLGITDSASKNQLVVVSVQYGPFYTYIPIRSTTIGKSRVAIDPIAMRISWRSNSDIASVNSIGYPRMKASGESSTTKHRLLHASGPHPIPPPNDPSKLHEVQKPFNDRIRLGFSSSESSSSDTSTQSDLADDKFKKMGFVKASALESVKYDDQNVSKLNYKGKFGIRKVWYRVC